MSNAFDKASLVMLPHAYEEGKLYSLKPTDRSGDFTFSRGTDTATRVNEQGYIEKETVNLLLQSNSFSDAAWTKNTTSVTSGQSGYDGTNDAWLLNSTGTGFPRIQQSISTSGVFVFSVYAKPATDGFMLIRTFGADAQVWFDLSDGSISTETGGQYISSTTEDVGNGWYRYSVLVNGSLTSVRIYPASAYGVYSPSGNGIYIQDAMINPGLVSQPYLDTTTAPVYGGLTDNMPRLDYSKGATCPSLLLEPSRTNSLGQSEYFDGYYANFGGVSFDINTSETLSPEGLYNATKLISSTNNTQQAIYKNITVSTPTLTCYAKAGEFDTLALKVSGGAFANFTLTGNGSIGYSPGLSAKSIEPVGNGWYRCSVSATTNSSYAWIAIDSGNLQGDGTSGIYIYGAQLESGSYPTSYIPTYGSTQTRAAESFSATGLANYLGDSEGTIFIEGEQFQNASLVSIIETTNSGVSMGVTGGNTFIFNVRVYGTNQADIQSGSIFTANTNFKLAGKYKTNDFEFFKDGASVGTDTSGTTFVNGDLITIQSNSSFAADQPFYGRIKQILVFPEALSDAECIALTQN